MEPITTKEFIKEVKKLGYECSEGGTISKNGVLAIIFSSKNEHYLNTSYMGYTSLAEDEKAKLFNLCVRYANTPLDKRGPEKKYYLKLDVSDKIEDFHNYLNYDKDSDCYIINSQSPYYSNCQTQFTQSEIDELEKKGLTKGFKKVEVDEL